MGKILISCCFCISLWRRVFSSLLPQDNWFMGEVSASPSHYLRVLLWFDMKCSQHLKIFPWLLTQWYPHAGGCFLFLPLLSLGYLLPGLLLDCSMALGKASLASLTLHTLMLLFLSSLASCTWLISYLIFLLPFMILGTYSWLLERQSIHQASIFLTHLSFSARGHDFLTRVTETKRKRKKWDMREVNRLSWC